MKPYLDNGSVSILVLALTSRTELCFFPLDLVTDPRQNDSFAVTFTRRYVIDEGAASRAPSIVENS